jgi:hypothetical protein
MFGQCSAKARTALSVSWLQSLSLSYFIHHVSFCYKESIDSVDRVNAIQGRAGKKSRTWYIHV